MNNDHAAIGIFDSGIGGLTVLKEVGNLLPEEDILYLGDTARVPYGVRSPETVARYSFECTRFLMEQHIKLLVVACNTVSAISLDDIRHTLSIPVIGVIEPGAGAAMRATKKKRVGVIGTEATIKSTAYVKAIQKLDPSIEVYGLPCPLFVPLVEEGWTEGPIARMVVMQYLERILHNDIDTLVLGCTHYPLLKGVLQEVAGGVCLIDSAIETAKAVKAELVRNGALAQGAPATKKFFVTDSPERFTAVGERFLNQKIDDIEKIQL